MNNLYDTLEICLQEMDNGVDLETLLARHPDAAAELRPLLQAASTAKIAAAPAPTSSMLHRNQVKVLRRFDQIWGAKSVANNWFPSVRFAAVAAVLLFIFLISGTSLVRASFSSLPGDSLYSIKRSWEDATIFFTFDGQARENLQLEYQAERLKELNQLIASGRTVQVDFVGIVTLQQGDEWRVTNIPVIVSARTALPKQAINEGAMVHVYGTTRGDGFVLADKIELLTAGIVSPELNDDHPMTQQPVATSEPGNENDSPETETGTPDIEVPLPTLALKIEKVEGTLIVINQDIWKVNAVFVDVSSAEIIGTPVIGAGVKAEGYFGLDGIFVAVKIEIINNSSNENNTNSNDNGGNANPDDNSDGNNNNSNEDSGSGGGGNDSNDNGGGHGGNGG